MKGKNYVFIATSLDGMIAGKNNSLDWLNIIPNPNNEDAGYVKFMKAIDAIIMGRTTFETVLSFGIDWPYKVPVFVLSNNLNQIPQKLDGKVELVSGDLNQIVNKLNEKGFLNLYIDGGKTIQSLLKEDLIDELILTRLPILLGEGTLLFSGLDNELRFEHKSTEVYLGEMVQSHYIRRRNE
jgi:dihydrofolate reductase